MRYKGLDFRTFSANACSVLTRLGLVYLWGSSKLLFTSISPQSQDNKPPPVHMIPHPLSDFSQLDSSSMISIVLYELSIYLLS